jgi:hypothetical protein
MQQSWAIFTPLKRTLGSFATARKMEKKTLRFSRRQNQAEQVEETIVRNKGCKGRFSR